VFKIVGVTLAVLIGLAILFVLAFLIYRLILWLLKKDQNAVKPMSPIKGIQHFLKACQVFLLRFWKKIMALVQGPDSAAMIYSRMLRWGRFSGLTPIPSDTPSEYGFRLMQSFPRLKCEIRMIVEAFNLEIYGRTATDRQSLARLASAYRSMRRLKHLWSRLKTWFYQSR
jgi:hypothetical protein